MASFCRGVHRNRDAVTRADIVKQKVAIRVERLVRERGGNLNSATINRGSRRCGDQSADVTSVASDRIEELGAHCPTAEV